MDDNGPAWAFSGHNNHFMIPPHYGRGNNNDAWIPICGDRNTAIYPWREVQFDQNAPYCKDCRKIMDQIETTKGKKNETD